MVFERKCESHIWELGQLSNNCWEKNKGRSVLILHTDQNNVIIILLKTIQIKKIQHIFIILLWRTRIVEAFLKEQMNVFNYMKMHNFFMSMDMQAYRMPRGKL